MCAVHNPKNRAIKMHNSSYYLDHATAIVLDCSLETTNSRVKLSGQVKCCIIAQ